MSTPSAPLLVRPLKNGGTLTVYDTSQQLAGDRWLVNLRCDVEMPVRDEFWRQTGPVEADLGTRIREKIGPSLRYLVEQQRTFVAAADMPTVVAALLQGIEANALHYFEAPSFPARLFVRQFAQCKEQCLAEDRDRAAQQTTAEDEGPADFSHCFSN